MVELTHTIQDPLGFHARPAYVVATEASRWESKVTFYKGERHADGKDALAIMSLNAQKGDLIRAVIEGPDEQDCAEFIHYILVRA